MNTLDKLFRVMMLTLLCGLALSFTACDDDEDDEEEATMTIYELVSADSDLSDLKSYIDADAELKGYAEGTTTHTLFAPNNAAFTKLEATLGSSLDIVAPDIVKATMLFQFVADDVSSDELVNGSFETLQGENIVGNGDGTIATGGSDDAVEVLEADIAATNGTVHVIETILIPPTLFATIGVNLGKLSQPILLGADFTILASAIAKADTYAAENELTTLTSILIGETAYTVFAPSNATFEAGSITADTYTAQQWYGIIANHVIVGSVAGSTLETCDEFSTLYTLDGVNFGALEIFNNTDVVEADNGIGVYIDSNGDVDCTLADSGASLTNLDAEVAIADAFEASNGILHVIAGVLAP
ncbi:MAG: fasciclin domain-containing protein [Reichenbachiella sp.]|uniref:fasciclin domain-containing protein n=1 Tax=Reichenbachiella sp. TaxID=2184521 RepID=UPI00329883CB